MDLGAFNIALFSNENPFFCNLTKALYNEYSLLPSANKCKNYEFMTK